MGYSCTAKADEVLREIVSTKKKSEKDPNILVLNGNDYFVEIGRENADGAITGSLYILLPGNLCQLKASFRIEPDGKISRFHGLTKKEKWDIYQRAMGKYQKIHGIMFMEI